jgi:hypothetical protein
MLLPICGLSTMVSTNRRSRSQRCVKLPGELPGVVPQAILGAAEAARVERL